MRTGVIAQKVGMTRLFNEEGAHVPVTVLRLDQCQVVAVRTVEKDGYTAVQLGTEPAKKLTRPEAGQLKDLPKAAQSLATIREFRVDSVDEFSVGQTFSVDTSSAAIPDADPDGLLLFFQ